MLHMISLDAWHNLSCRAGAPLLVLILSVTAVASRIAGAAAGLEFQVRLETVMEHDDGKFLWYHPRVAPVPSRDGPAIVLTLQKELGISDYYSGLFVMQRKSLDGAWQGPTAVPELDWRREAGGITTSVADVTPGWHAPTGKVLAIGCQVPYGKDGRQLDDKPRQHQTVYAVHDPQRGTWSHWQMLAMPADRKFDFCRNACAQWLVKPDGALLVPVYFGPNAKEPYSVTVVECRFDGERLRYIRHGDELALRIQRGLCEPSIVAFKGRYFLALRNDERGYVSVSADGLRWQPIKPWTFEDDRELGSYNTQQHWLAHSEGLFLVYTRRGANNDHIIRHRAPLFIAQVDPDKLQVIRRTERVLVPERGAELGNFGAAAIDQKESWVTVSEGVFSKEARQRGAKGATFVARIIWSKPNQLAPAAPAQGSARLRLATFSADVTVPLGHGMMGGAWLSKSIADPLEAHGFVLLGGGKPVVFVSVDWCEIRNDAYERWQTVLAEAAGTAPERVVVTTVHQHDAPVADLGAERLLRSRKLVGTVCDPEFHERAVQAVAKALREALKSARPLTHIGMGETKVEKIASNRRYIRPDGAVRFDRTSSTRNPVAISADEGLIDPMLKTLSFWDDQTPLAAVSFYAVHPMSYYGAGDVSADFPGLARRKRQAETPGVMQIYCSGASGNITAGKYNTGARENRAVLADRLHTAMVAAWRNTRRQAVTQFDFRATPLRLEPRDGRGFTVAELEAKLTADTKPFQQCLAAMGLSWRNRVDAGHRIAVPVIDFGAAQVLLLPGESYVEYQLAAQRARPDSFVCVAGYGEGATGYIPTEKHITESDPNLGDWCWVAPGSEQRMLKAIRAALKPNAQVP